MKFWIAVLMAGSVMAQEGWISLFNGKDLSGWRSSGDASTFRVEDGALVTRGGVAHLFHDGDWKNFELMVDVMARPNSNGGIYFHTEFQDRGFPRKGFEVQVNNTYAVDPIKTGSLYHVLDVETSAIGDNQWYTTHIVVQGDTVTVRLNGKQVVQWKQPAEWNGGREGPGRVLGRGSIALQGHDANSTVFYKNVRIKPLP